ncbi:MAG: DUF2480 family protein [Flavobacteriales bacterium]|nr:DUF2480 family protein [Flavobacteriales bacterium]
MSENDPIINKVASSGIITLDMEEMYPAGERVVFDLKPLLWEEVALREDDLRAFCNEHDWSQYAGNLVSVQCSADAIVPTWAFMLVATHLQPHVAFVTQGSIDQLERAIFTRFVQRLDVEPYRNARVVVKGCSKLPVPLNAYVELSAKLLPVVKSLMFGEPCSTVPLYKAPKQ